MGKEGLLGVEHGDGGLGAKLSTKRARSGEKYVYIVVGRASGAGSFQTVIVPTAGSARDVDHITNGTYLHSHS